MKTVNRLIMKRRTSPIPKWALSTVVLATVFGNSASVAAQSEPPDLPFAILCWSEEGQNWRYGYLATVTRDNKATYFSPNGHLSVGVGSNGIVQEPSDRPAVNDCFGRSIDELRAAGRVLDFPSED